MTKFAEVAAAVEPVLRMLDENEAGFSSANIFEDGSGSIIVQQSDEGKARELLLAHGVKLDGTTVVGGNYEFDLDLPSLLKFTTMLCPHCGKDTTKPPKTQAQAEAEAQAQYDADRPC